MIFIRYENFVYRRIYKLVTDYAETNYITYQNLAYNHALSEK